MSPRGKSPSTPSKTKSKSIRSKGPPLILQNSSTSSSGRRGPPARANRDDDTISELSYGTAKFARRRAAAQSEDKGKESESITKKSSSESSTKENLKDKNKLKKRTNSWGSALFGKKKDKKDTISSASPTATPPRRPSPTASRGQSVYDIEPADSKAVLSTQSKVKRKSSNSSVNKDNSERGKGGFLIGLDRTLTAEI
jgi:hypothetical protein